MELERRISTLITPMLDAMGYELVRVQITGDRHKTMQIMAERHDQAAMTVEDCAAISREMSAILDVEDPIAGRHDLEVSSPGIDRPLVKPTDFERYAGFDARIETERAVHGRKKFKGKLLGIKGDLVEMHLGAETVELPFSGIRRAKLLLTDELLQAAQATNG